MKKLLVALCVVLVAAQAQAQDKSLLDRARTEGKASFYANITAIEPILKAFTADTGVKAEYTRISTSKFVATAITEFEGRGLVALLTPVLRRAIRRGQLGNLAKLKQQLEQR